MSIKNRQLPPNHYYSTLGAKTKELVKCIEDATTFEQDSTNFLATYGNDSVISSFVSEYQKVLHVIKRSKNKCVSLLSKAEGIEMEYAQHEHNSVNIEKLQSDTEKSQALRTQINRAEITLLTYAKREEQSKDDIRQLRQDVSNLTMTIKQGVGLSPAQEKSINELVLMKEQTSKELQAEMEKITTFRTSITGMSEKIEAMEKEEKEIDRETATLKEKNAAKKIEIDVELGTKEKFERDLRELRVIVTIKSQEAVAKQAAVSRLIEDITSIDSQIKQQKAQIEKLLRDQELLGTRTVKLQQDYNDQMVYTNELSQQNEVALVNLKVKERELARQKNEAKLIMRTKEALVKKSRILEDRKTEEENDRRVLKEHNSALFLAIEQKKRNVEIAKKTIEELNHENDILKAGLKKAQNETMKLSNLLVLQRQHEATLELDIARSVRDVALNEKKIEQLSEEKEKLTAESSHIANQSMATLAELKNFEMQIYEYKRQSLQAENKLKYQQNLYEAVQSDRKLHSKQLIESQAEIAEMKRNLKIMNFQINGFKEEANSKNSLFIKESEALLKLSKDSEIIKDEIKQLKSQNELAHAYIKTQMIEEFKLEQFVKEAEVEKERQQNALNVVLAEKENLSSQLLTRNQELNTIYNKIKTQNLELLRGEMHFRNKMREIHALREETLKIRMQAAEAQIETETLTPMKHLTVKLRKQITQSQARIKALEEELENPINIHRWRKLEGSQPQTYAMLQLLHTLQKKLIQKTKEELDKGRAIEEKEKLYLHLKAILAKQSGPETQIQIQEFRKVAKEKKLQLRHMETELNMYKSQVKEYKHTIEAIDAGLADCKSQFLKMYQKKARDMQNQGSASPATFMEENQIDDNESFNGVHFEKDVQIIENDVSDNEYSGSDDFIDETGENSLLGAGLATIVGE